MAGDAGDDEVMLRGMYGPDVTFLGVPRAMDDPTRWTGTTW